MEYKRVLHAFGGLSKTAQALDYSMQRVHAWKNRKRIPSPDQIRLANLKPRLRPDHEAQRWAKDLAIYVNGKKHK